MNKQQAINTLIKSGIQVLDGKIAKADLDKAKVALANETVTIYNDVTRSEQIARSTRAKLKSVVTIKMAEIQEDFENPNKVVSVIKEAAKSHGFITCSRGGGDIRVSDYNKEVGKYSHYYEVKHFDENGNEVTDLDDLEWTQDQGEILINSTSDYRIV